MRISDWSSDVCSSDLVLGLYYLSMEREGEPGEGMMISDMSEVHQALNAKAVTLHSKIVSRVPQTDEDGNQYMKRFEQTTSEERRVGKEGVSTCRYRWCPAS